MRIMVGIFAVVLEGVAPARGSRHLLSAQPDGPGLAQAQEVTGPVEQDSTARHAFGLLLALGIDTICTLQSILLQLYGSAPEIRCVPLLNDFVARFCPAPRGVLAGRREKRTSTAFFFSVFIKTNTAHRGHRSAQLQEVASPSALKARQRCVRLYIYPGHLPLSPAAACRGAAKRKRDPGPPRCQAGALYEQ